MLLAVRRFPRDRCRLDRQSQVSGLWGASASGSRGRSSPGLEQIQGRELSWSRPLPATFEVGQNPFVLPV